MQENEKFCINEITFHPFNSLNYNDKQLIWRMRTHPEVAKWMLNGGDFTLESHIQFMEKLKDNNINFDFLVKDKIGVIGVVALHNFDEASKTAWLDIYKNPFRNEEKLGEKMLRGIVHFAYKCIKVKHIKLEVMSNNLKAIRFYTKNNFQKITEHQEQSCSYATIKTITMEHFGEKEIYP